MTARYPIRVVTDDEFVAFTAVPSAAFLEDWLPEEVVTERQILEFDRTIAAFDGTQMVGTASAYSFRLTVPGGTARAAGISLVSVLPSHRRQGVLTGMMRHVITDAGQRGEALAILFASEPVIYPRFGFGLASWQQRVRIERGDALLTIGEAAAETCTVRLRFVPPDQVRAELVAVFEAVLPSRPGMLARDSRWWDYFLADNQARRGDMSSLRCIVAEDDAGPRGYALYRTKASWAEGIPDGTLRIRELMATDPAATVALWTDLTSRDLVAEVIANMRPVDDPLLAMMADPRRARSAISDALWLRLIDVPAALCQRSYASEVDIVVDVTDRFLPANAGRWRLRAGGPAARGEVTCERTSDAADLLLSVQALGACYLGGASFAQLAAAGHIRELAPGAMARLSTAMSWDPSPWCCTAF